MLGVFVAYLLLGLFGAGCGGGAAAPRGPKASAALDQEPARTAPEGPRSLRADRSTADAGAAGSPTEPASAANGDADTDAADLPHSAGPTSWIHRPSTSEPRRAGGLVVHDPPRAPQRTTPTRMRSHVEGGLSAGHERVWVGPPVPAEIPLAIGSLELFILDPVGDGYLALYRAPYGTGTCALSGNQNCGYEVRLYARDGTTTFSLPLNPLLSRTDHLEVQDLALSGGVLYLNEACQSYSRMAGGRCSSLIAIAPETGRLLWRTRPLVSNGRFLILGDVAITAYGFTDEFDYLSLVRLADGHVLQRSRLPRAAEGLSIHGNRLEVQLYGSTTYLFDLVGQGTATPRLRFIERQCASCRAHPNPPPP